MQELFKLARGILALAVRTETGEGSRILGLDLVSLARGYDSRDIKNGLFLVFRDIRQKTKQKAAEAAF